jgi:hypothetical protein
MFRVDSRAGAGDGTVSLALNDTSDFAEEVPQYAKMNVAINSNIHVLLFRHTSIGVFAVGGRN